MRHFVSTLLAALLGGLASAQIGDAQAIAAARPFVERFAPEASNAAPSIYRETLDTATGQTVVIHVNFDDFVVFLTESGEFRALANMGGERRVIGGSEPDKYQTDEEAWRALEAILADFEIPSGLTRKELVRNAPGGEPYIMRFVMHPRPYGYEAEGGNAVHASMHQKTGRLRSLRISKGWTYEPPNVRISQEQAINSTTLAYGGEPEDWQVSLQYRSFAKPNVPEYVRALSANKTMRLFYALWGSRGEVRIDSVTGEIVDFISPAQIGAAHRKTAGHGDVMASVLKTSDNTQSTANKSDDPKRTIVTPDKDLQAESSPSMPGVALITLAALAGLGGLALVFRRSQNT